MALSILVDARKARIQDLVADVFRFGMYVIKHGDEVDNIEKEMTEEEQMERAKLCLQCNHLSSSGGTLRCKRDKCIYE